MGKRRRGSDATNLMLENFVTLQHVLTDVSTNLVRLNEQLSGLLGIFEEAAKGFVEGGKKEGKVNAPEANQLITKLDMLLEQNKTIAKGLTLLEQKVREQTTEPNQIPEG